MWQSKDNRVHAYVLASRWLETGCCTQVMHRCNTNTLTSRDSIWHWLLRGTQHQISSGDNYNQFYLLLFDRIAITSSHGLGVRGCGWYIVGTHTSLKFTHVIPYDAIFSSNLVLLARLRIGRLFGYQFLLFYILFQLKLHTIYHYKCPIGRNIW